MISLNEYKKSKNANKICKELIEVIALVNETRKKLKKHDKYVPVKDIIMCLGMNQTIMEIHLNKLKRLIK